MLFCGGESAGGMWGGVGGEEAVSILADPSPAMDGLRRKLCDAIGPFTGMFGTAKSGGTIKEFATELFGLLGRLNVRETLCEWISHCRENDEHEQAAQHEQ